MNDKTQTSNSTLGPYNFSTASSQSFGDRILQRSSGSTKQSQGAEAKDVLCTGSLGGPSFSFSDSATNFPSITDEVSDENNSSILNTPKKQQRKKGNMISRSFDLPPKSPRGKANSSRSLPSLRRIFTRSRSIDEKKSPWDDNHAAEDAKRKHNCQSEPIVLSEPIHNAPKLASSFDLPSAQVLYSSPAMSLPSPRRLLKFSSKSSDDNKPNLSAPNSSQQMYMSPQRSLPLDAITITQSSIDKKESAASGSSCRPAQSLNIHSTQNMYTSPHRSLPLEKSVEKKVSDAPESSRPFNSGKKGRTHMLKISKSLDLDGSLSVSSEASTSEQQKKGWRSAQSLCLSSSEQFMRNSSNTTPPPEASSGQCTSSSISPFYERECSLNKSTGAIKHTFSDTVATETSEPSEEDNLITIVTESDDGDNDGEVSTEDLRVLAVVKTSFDEKSQACSVSTESMSACTQEACILDLVQEAIGNIGRGDIEVTSVLKEMRANKIETIEDLLKVGPKEFIASLADKELAMEIRRLLDETNYEEASLDSIYADENFLPVGNISASISNEYS